jgi:hypothetical protein
VRALFPTAHLVRIVRGGVSRILARQGVQKRATFHWFPEGMRAWSSSIEVISVVPQLERRLGGAGAGRRDRRRHGWHRRAYMDVFTACFDGPSPTLARQLSYRANHLDRSVR